MNVRWVAALVSLTVCVVFASPVFANLGDSNDPDSDVDGDGIINRNDNCYTFANPNQIDADGDGYGNICDTDLNNDGNLDLADLNLFAQAFQTNFKPADFNSDGLVNFLDLRIFRSRLAIGRPGPAAVVRWIGASGSWNDTSNWYPAETPSPLFVSAIIDVPDGTVHTINMNPGFPSARFLEVTGDVVFCGTLSVLKSAIIVGDVNVECPNGELRVQDEILLDGQLELNHANLITHSLSHLGDSESLILTSGNSEIGGPSILDSVLVLAIDIIVEPDARTSISSDIKLDDANIVLRSLPEQPALIDLGIAAVTGSGSIRFSGPSDPDAIGNIFSFNNFELGEDISIEIDPGAYGQIDGFFTSSADITVTDSSTLYFDYDGFLNNSGTITCSDNGHILDRGPDGPSTLGDSILINSPGGSFTAVDCTVRWPTRLTNEGQYSIASSNVSLPITSVGGNLVDITQSDLTIEPFRLALPHEFYIFDPAGENSVLLTWLFDLRKQSLLIDGEKWRFAKSSALNFPPSFEFGTLISNTPLAITADETVSAFFVDFETDINLEPSSELDLRGFISLNGDIAFSEPDNCLNPEYSAAVLRLQDNLEVSADPISITAVSQLNDGSGCLNAEIISDGNLTLSSEINLNVVNADVSVRTENDYSLKIDGSIDVSGSDATLDLQRTTLAGPLTCSNGATVNASGSEATPFINQQVITGTDCNLNFSDYWHNDGLVSATGGFLTLSGPSEIAIDPGTGQFNTNMTAIDFNMIINDPSQLVDYGLTVSGGSFAFGGDITNPGLEFDLDAFPGATTFTHGFTLADTRVVGTQPLRLDGNTTLKNVTLAADAFLMNNATLTITDQLTLDQAVLGIRSSSNNDQAPALTQVIMDGASSISGIGVVAFEAEGDYAVSEMVQTISTTPIVIDAGIDVYCYAGGLCKAQAGSDSELSILGNLLLESDESVFRFNSNTSLHKLLSLRDRASIEITDGHAFTFSGPLSSMTMELFTGIPAGPGLVAEGSATIDITDASFSLFAESGFVLESGVTVVALSHKGDAQRIGEFADVSGAQIDGIMFIPDYSQTNQTVFSGPLF